MGSLAVVHENLLDDATVTASDSEILMPATLLQDPHVLRRWRSLTTTPSVLTTLIGPFDTITIRGMTVTADCSIRVRVSSADVTGAAGDLYDSNTPYPGGIETGDLVFDINYGALTILLPAGLTGYLRIDFDEDDSGRTYVEAGRLFAGLRTQFQYNFKPGATLAWVDPSIRARTVGGQTQVRRKDKFRAFEISQDLTETQRYGLVETMDRVNGTTGDILVIINPESTNLARDSILGLVTETTPIAYQNIYDANGPIFDRQWRVEERL